MQKSPYLVFIIMLTFFVISFLSNIIGPLIPDIIQGFQLNLTLVALLPFAFSLLMALCPFRRGCFWRYIMRRR